jgi:hypothetical protein
MGTIARFDLPDLMQRYGLTCFVETGTGTGDGLAHAAKFPFVKLRSCEYEIGLVKQLYKRFPIDDRIHFLCSDSVWFLERSGACNAKEPILFWLDAHFPGADYGLKPYGHETNTDTRLPLERELKAIGLRRPKGQDVIICDDLRIYMDGPFQHGNLPADLRSLCPAERNIDFVHQIMGTTHDIELLFEHEGYIVMTPKGKVHG